MCRRLLTLPLLLLAGLAWGAAPELPLLFQDDFRKGASPGSRPIRPPGR